MTFKFAKFKFQGQLGINGIQNFGNTCYINSILQCLLSSQQLVDYFLNDYKKDGSDTITDVFYAIVNANMSSAGIGEKPKALKDKIGNLEKRFATNDQHDSHEFLIKLLNCLDENTEVSN